MPQMDLEEQFSLKWNDFQSNLSTGFQHLLEEELMLDVTLSAGGKSIQAHKIVLSVCSSYFKNLFQTNPCKHPVIILKDVGMPELMCVLSFMYRGEAYVNKENLASFLRLAENLKVKGLVDNAPDEDETENESSEFSKRLSLKKKSRTSDSFTSDTKGAGDFFGPPKKRKKKLTHLTKLVEPVIDGDKENNEDEQNKSDFKEQNMHHTPMQEANVNSSSHPEEKSYSNDFLDSNLDNDNDEDDFGDDNMDDFGAGPSNSDDNAENLPSGLKLLTIAPKPVEFLRREDCTLGVTAKGGRRLTCRSYEYTLNVCKLTNNMQTLYWKCAKYVQNFRRAPIWHYYLENEQKGTVVCRVCLKEFANKRSWGTANMKRHLKLHPLENAYTRALMQQEVDNKQPILF